MGYLLSERGCSWVEEEEEEEDEVMVATLGSTGGTSLVSSEGAVEVVVNIVLGGKKSLPWGTDPNKLKISMLISLGSTKRLFGNRWLLSW